jgi:hypothetical protein
MLSHAGSATYLILSVASRRVGSTPLPIATLGAFRLAPPTRQPGGSCPPIRSLPDSSPEAVRSVTAGAHSSNDPGLASAASISSIERPLVSMPSATNAAAASAAQKARKNIAGITALTDASGLIMFVPSTISASPSGLMI